MKNLLVTGGCGFIGSNLIRYLFTETDFEGNIINVDKLTYAGNPENLKDIEKEYKDRYTFIQADICDGMKMEHVFNTYPIDSVCHLAAESHVDRSIDDPDSFVTTNIFGTLRLLELARRRKDQIRFFYYVSTDEVFGSASKGESFTEYSPYNPGSPYSASKAAADHLVRAYYNTYKVPTIISNCTNNYGPYQFPEKLIPLAIINAIEEKPIPVYGAGINIRDWLYVIDHCSAIYTIMKGGIIGETYNICGGYEKQNIEVIQSICYNIDVMLDREGGTLSLVTFVKDRPGHDLRYSLCSDKLKNSLGWAPNESFYTGLTKTVLWYINNRDWVENISNGEYRNWIKKHYSL
jgi:dTDP-glucose 4,6-dehydratase